MAQQRTQRTRWFFWFGWSPEKLASWLSEQAAEGWQLVKVDGLLNRFHFRRSEPEHLQFFIDYMGEMNAEYRNTMHATGWMLHTAEMGWCIWQTSFDSEPPLAVNMNVRYLIEHNRRLLLAFLAPLFAIVIQIPLQLRVWPTLWGSWLGKIFIGTVVVCMVVLAGAVIFTLGKIRQLQKRDPLQ